MIILGVLTIDEIKQIINKAKEYDKGEEKSLFIELLYLTGSRPKEILTLTWHDIKEEDGEYYILFKNAIINQKVIISKQLFDRLAKIKTNTNNSLFNLSKDELKDTMQRLKNDLDNNNIHFHAIRKTSIINGGKM